MIGACDASSSPAPRSRSTTCSPSRAAARRSRSTLPRSMRWPQPVPSSTARSRTETPAYGVTTGVGSRKVFDVEADGHDRLLVRQHRISQGAPVAARGGARDGAPARERPRAGDDRGSPRARIASRRGAERRPAARDPRRSARSARAISPRWPISPTAILGRLRARAGRGDRAAQPERVRDGLRARSRSPTRSCCSTSSTTQGRSTSRRSARTGTPSIRPSGTHGPIPGCSRRWRASARCSRAARSRRATCRTRSRSGRSPSRTAPRATRSAFVGAQLAIELNAAQSNPLVVVAEDRVISVGNFEMQPLATALDLARLALAPVISTAAERAVKLLQRNADGPHRGPRRAARAWRRARSASTASRSRRSRSRHGCSRNPSRSISSRRPRRRGSRTG